MPLPVGDGVGGCVEFGGEQGALVVDDRAGAVLFQVRSPVRTMQPTELLISAPAGGHLMVVDRQTFRSSRGSEKTIFSSAVVTSWSSV